MVFGIGAKNPEKFEQRALAYEQKGKTKKAEKNRAKAAKIHILFFCLLLVVATMRGRVDIAS